MYRILYNSVRSSVTCSDSMFWNKKIHKIKWLVSWNPHYNIIFITESLTYESNSTANKTYRETITEEFETLPSASKHDLFAQKLGIMCGKSSLILFANLIILIVKAENNGNTLVNCAACQMVQVQDWSCDVNCQVIKGNNGEYRWGVTSSY